MVWVKSFFGIVMLVLVLVTVLSLAVDYVASVYGAKRLGATWRGATGAIVGGLIGIFFNLPGILLGPFIGATAFELAGGRTFKDSSRAGVGATLGLLAGAIGILSVDKTHILYTTEVAAKAAGSKPFSSLGEQAFLTFAVIVGLVAAPVQAASRSLLGRFVPASDTP